jgi:hypothetical protein
MAPGTLVEKMLEDGGKVVEKLLEFGFDLTSAFWLQTSEDGKWRFYIVSALVESEGPIKAYKRLHPLVHALPDDSSVDPLQIKLIGPTNPMARDVLAIQRQSRNANGSPMRWGGTRLGEMSIDDAYLYPLPFTAP